MANDLNAFAAVLRNLHVPGRPLVLPNVWDVTSARAVAEAGYPAIATSSAAVAGSLGYDDGQQAPAVDMFAAAARIAGSVDVPVTVDAEGGYGLAPEQFVDALLGAGAVGCNLEDTDHRTGALREIEAQADYLAGVREAAAASGVDIVVNARIDVFITAPPGTAASGVLDDALARARRYLDAGADCVYPILLHDPETAGAFCAALAPWPVNLLGSYVPDAGRIGLTAAAAAGAARVSFGPDLWRATTRAMEALIPPIA